MTIGSNIKRLRQQVGLSQVQLSKRAGVTQQLISQLENEVNVSLKSIPKIAKALGVHISEIDINADKTTYGSPDVTYIPILTMQEVLIGANEAQDEDTIALTGIYPGDWIAMEMGDDSIDRIAPPGALVVVNRAETALEDGGLYLFSIEGKIICRRYRNNGEQELLMPFSINPEYIAKPYHRQIHAVIGRVRRSVLEI